MSTLARELRTEQCKQTRRAGCSGARCSRPSHVLFCSSDAGKASQASAKLSSSFTRVRQCQKRLQTRHDESTAFSIWYIQCMERFLAKSRSIWFVSLSLNVAYIFLELTLREGSQNLSHILDLQDKTISVLGLHTKKSLETNRKKALFTLRKQWPSDIVTSSPRRYFV